MYWLREPHKHLEEKHASRDFTYALKVGPRRAIRSAAEVTPLQRCLLLSLTKYAHESVASAGQAINWQTWLGHRSNLLQLSPAQILWTPVIDPKRYHGSVRQVALVVRVETATAREMQKPVAGPQPISRWFVWSPALHNRLFLASHWAITTRRLCPLNPPNNIHSPCNVPLPVK